MSEYETLPVGTVCRIKGNPKTVMIITRGGLINRPDDTHEYYDYGACLYPEGMVGASLVFFNAEEVDELVFRGYECPEEDAFNRSLAAKVAKLGLAKGTPKAITPEDLEAFRSVIDQAQG
jgi:hypothetical protein